MKRRPDTLSAWADLRDGGRLPPERSSRSLIALQLAMIATTVSLFTATVIGRWS
ncbi:hypothetical protein [Roseivivax marinus]|uniref:hypothetical protein n=1 Tax=Roseivivax marinus TaxID=1379903 RepID=UPI00273FEAFA|nr:hypothetical protein [Roseivivax marinus]